MMGQKEHRINNPPRDFRKKERGAAAYLSYSMIYFFYFFSLGTFNSMLSIYLANNEKSSAEIAFIVSGAGIFTMILQPLIGRAYDRFRREVSISIFLLLMSAVAGLLFSTTNITVALFLLNGLSMAFLNSVSSVCERIATQSPFRYGVIRLWGAVGYAASSQLSGIIFESVSPRLNFILFAAALVLTCVGFWKIGAGKRPETAKKQEDTPPKTAGSNPLRNRSFWIFAAFCFLFSGTTGASSTYLPLLLNGQLGSSSLVGTILLFTTLMEIPILFCLGQIYG